MKGDFSRFHRLGAVPNVTRVLMQQGRVQLDSDWNEQNAVLLGFLWRLAEAVIGPYGGVGPKESLGFKVFGAGDGTALTEAEKAFFEATPPRPGDFGVGGGVYFVRGRLCAADGPLLYTRQASLPSLEPLNREGGATYHVYLDVWELYRSARQAEAIPEVALGGVDTCGRAVLMCQVRAMPVPREGGERRRPRPFVAPPEVSPVAMRARTRKETGPPDLCLARADSGYRGLENQLYRVEVQRGGPAGRATFTWSRDNGSVEFGVASLRGGTARLTSLGRDARSTLSVEDWVELLDDGLATSGEPAPLFQVADVDPAEMTVTLRRGTVDPPTYGEDDAPLHPILRRWDYRRPDLDPSLADDDGALPIAESASQSTGWIELEDGIEIQFQPAPETNQQREYRTGDHWLIPARTLTGDIDWPKAGDGFQAPRGRHVFAPLAQVSLDAQGRVKVDFDLRSTFESLAKPVV